MDELLELREFIEHQDYDKALLLINEMEEMSKDDKIHKIRSYAIVLLIHLIKKQAENRTTRSWELSIKNAVREISIVNKRRKSGGFYANHEDLFEVVSDSFEPALDYASVECFEGMYDADELLQKINKSEIIGLAMQLIDNAVR
jgi:hypothetical protein